MTAIRAAQTSDLEAVASWLRDQADCTLWAGRRVSFPVDPAVLPQAIEWDSSDSWSATAGANIVAFGQLVPKPRRRVHLARLIAAPGRRGEGLGRFLATHLLNTALSGHPSTVSLNVVRGNEPALNLYRSLGFTEAARPSDEPASESLYLEHLAQRDAAT